MTKRKAACVHHWVLSSSTESLRGAKAKENPNCVGRPARCRKCDAKTVLLEREFVVSV